MNRPPKKKNQSKDGLSEDPRFSSEELAQAGSEPKKAPVTGDDRNLVEIDDAFSEADIEDRVWLFWQRNKGSIVAAIVILIGGVIGVNVWKMMQDNKVASLQADYSAAYGEPEQLKTFASKHGDTPLAGLALLDLADTQYTDKDYAAAAGLYQQSLKPLQGTVVSGRARLGLGMAQIKAGQTDQGRSTLTSLIADNSALSTIRAEAGYELAQLELLEGNRSAAASVLQQVRDMSNAEIWSGQADRLMQSERLGEYADA
ncbi:MAG: tetratricopeptide repeat protein [Puniceicoccales bacterium]